MKLLVVEDEVKTADALAIGLKENGFDVTTAYDGEMALNVTKKIKFDLIITDIIMPKIDGIELCKRLRSAGNHTPVIMITALGLTANKVNGFNSGADDYIVKPFDFEELLARVKAMMNRVRKKTSATNYLKCADLKLNLDTKEVYRGDKMLTLTAKEFALLEYFMKNRNRVISKEEIAQNVWDIHFDTGTNIVEVYVSYLRNKIDKDFEDKYLHTRKGLGYIFREEK